MDDLTLTTERLVLRPFQAGDAPRVQELASAREVASMTLSVPHPYPAGTAAAWIAMHAAEREKGSAYHFAITVEGLVVGYIGIHQEDGAIWLLQDKAFEISCWLGVPYWSHGYASEATKVLLAFAFGPLALPLVVAGYFADNAASSRTLLKAGFNPVRRDRQYCKARNEAVDCVLLTLTRDAWAAKQV